MSVRHVSMIAVGNEFLAPANAGVETVADPVWAFHFWTPQQAQETLDTVRDYKLSREKVDERWRDARVVTARMTVEVLP